MGGAGVYLAGPSGFTDAGRRWHAEVLRPAVEAAGFVALDPWAGADEIFDSAASLADANRDVARRNTDLIRRSSAVLAVLDGTDVDSGTAAEIGYAAALGVPVVGLRTDLRIAGDNEAATINLQVQYFLDALCTDVPDAIDALRRVVKR